MSARGLKEYSLAKATGVPQPTIHRICSGESKDPKTPTLEKIARYLGVSIAELRGTQAPAAQPRFTALSQDALEVLSAWERLPADRQQAYKDFLFFEVFAIEQMPWLRRGRPIRESYDQYEQRMKSLGSAKLKGKQETRK